MIAEGMCHLCGHRVAAHVDHDGFGVDHGPVRGWLCVNCNQGLGFVERVGLEGIGAYLGASPIGPPYALARSERQKEYRKLYHQANLERNRERARRNHHLRKLRAA